MTKRFLAIVASNSFASSSVNATIFAASGQGFIWVDLNLNQRDLI